VLLLRERLRAARPSSRVDRLRLSATAALDGWPPARASGCTEPGLQAGSPAAQPPPCGLPCPRGRRRENARCGRVETPEWTGITESRDDDVPHLIRCPRDGPHPRRGRARSGQGRAAVCQEAIDAGVLVCTGGLEDQKASIVATDGTVTDGPYPEAIVGPACWAGDRRVQGYRPARGCRVYRLR
jgi:hypothetical protein